MSQTATIVSVIAIVGWLILVMRNPQIRTMGLSKALRLAAIWAVIIVGLVLVIRALT